jgi:hypothetical protein
MSDAQEVEELLEFVGQETSQLDHLIPEVIEDLNEAMRHGKDESDLLSEYWGYSHMGRLWLLHNLLKMREQKINDESWDAWPDKYAIGTEESAKSGAMTHGPFNCFYEAVDFAGGPEMCVIYALKDDGRIIPLRRWDSETETWTEIGELGEPT